MISTWALSPSLSPRTSQTLGPVSDFLSGSGARGELLIIARFNTRRGAGDRHVRRIVTRIERKAGPCRRQASFSRVPAEHVNDDLNISIPNEQEDGPYREREAPRFS
jgi:hypothetical protein